MNTIIDLGTELLVDRSKIRDPHVRLLLQVLGKKLAKGSAWVALSKETAIYYGVAPAIQC